MASHDHMDAYVVLDAPMDSYGAGDCSAPPMSAPPMEPIYTIAEETIYQQQALQGQGAYAAPHTVVEQQPVYTQAPVYAAQQQVTQPVFVQAPQPVQPQVGSSYNHDVPNDRD